VIVQKPDTSSSAGQNVRTWWDLTPGIKKRDSLDLATAGATGVSDGSAHNIPALLLPKEISGRKIADITEAKIESARLGTADSFRVQGKYADDPITLWIDKKTFLVRRIETQSKFDNFRTEQTTTYDPVIDGAITDKMLKFDPPEEK
jgi:hypothetical protein